MISQKESDSSPETKQVVEYYDLADGEFKREFMTFFCHEESQQATRKLRKAVQ